MRKTNIKAQKKYHLIISLLSILDENVISEEEYILIENKNANIQSDLRDIFDFVIKPWFLRRTPSIKYEIIQSISTVIECNQDEIEIENAFKRLTFVFDYEIEDKVLFLTRIKNFLEEWVNEEKIVC